MNIWYIYICIDKINYYYYIFHVNGINLRSKIVPLENDSIFFLSNFILLYICNHTSLDRYNRNICYR